MTLAVVQAKVLVKAAELHREMLLLFPASPMPMFCQPLMGLRKELSAALQARETDHGEASVPGFATHVLEAKKLKSLWPFRAPVPLRGCRKAPEGEQPGFVLGQFQIESSEPFSQLSLIAVRIFAVLEASHKVIGEPHQVRLAASLRFDLLRKPQIERKVQVQITEHRRYRPPLRDAFLSVDEGSVLHDPGLQPFRNEPKDHRVGNAVSHHLVEPPMVDSREVAADVGLVHVAYLLGHDVQAQFLQCVVRISPRPEAITAVEEVRFEDSFQYARNRPLQEPVGNRGNSQRSCSGLARSFGYFHPSDRRGSVAACLQLCGSLRLAAPRRAQTALRSARRSRSPHSGSSSPKSP